MQVRLIWRSMMGGFHVYTSNSLDLLFDEMAESLTGIPRDLFSPEIIVTQSRGMRRWLSLRFAQKFSVSASYNFQFPNQLIDILFSSVLTDIPAERFIEQNRDVWRLMHIIRENVNSPECFALKNYLGSPADAVKLHQLSAKLIDLYDQYITYRPDMITGWDEGSRDDGWQSALWKIFRAGSDGYHPPEMKNKFTSALKLSGAAEKVPGRIILFAVPVLPRFHMEVLAAASELIDIKMYILNPSPEYWFDTKSETAILRAMKKYPGRSADELHLDPGNRLLSSMGRYGADFLLYLEESGIDLISDNMFREPRGNSVLSKIQTDIFELNSIPDPGERIVLAEDIIRHDASLTFHSCHGKMREVEALKDFILDRFNSVPGLKSDEIIVMSPDIEDYVPYIHAVFGPGASEIDIPYSIVDRKSSDGSPAIKGLMQLLQLPEGRCTSSNILAMLESDIIRESFSIEEDELPYLKEWISAANIRWGLDDEDRAAAGYPEFTANTWMSGLDRLVLGYAAGEEFEFNGIVSAVEGAASPELLGRFCDFISAVSDWVKISRAGHPPEEWRVILNGIIEKFFSVGESAREELFLITAPLVHMKDSGADDLPLRVILSHIRNSVSSSYTRGEFITGRIVFCSMLPMRSVPFRIICLLGMNDGAFPRKNRPPDFDLIARSPMPGDRSISDEDRYLFLETIISARDALYLSFTGRSAKDNTELPPSACVSELMDYVDSCFTITGKDSAAKDGLLAAHRLQPFSPDYFSGKTNLYSFSSGNLAASERSTSKRKINPFFIRHASGADEPVTEIRLNELIYFFKNPAAYYLRSTLGIKIQDRFLELQEDEPFELDSLIKYNLAAEFIDSLARGDDLSSIKRRALLKGDLPPGPAGARAVKETASAAEEFFNQYKKYLTAEKVSAFSGEADISGIRISGEISNITRPGIIDCRRSSLKAADLAAAWITHLFLHTASSVEKDFPLRINLIRKNKFYIFSECSSAREHLEYIISLYLKGLNEPLKFFPETSLAYFNHKDKISARDTAAALWTDGDYNRDPESADAAYRLAFRDADVIDDEFEDISKKVFGALFESAAEQKAAGDAEE